MTKEMIKLYIRRFIEDRMENREKRKGGNHVRIGRIKRTTLRRYL